MAGMPLDPALARALLAAKDLGWVCGVGEGWNVFVCLWGGKTLCLGGCKAWLCCV